MNDIKELIKKGQTKRPPRIVIVGVEGVGKSTAGRNCPNPIFLCAEDGLVGKDFEEVRNFSPNSWQEVLDFIDFLINGEHDYKTLVVDTLDWLEPIMIEHICFRDNQKDMASYGYGNGYIALADEFRIFLALLEKLWKDRNMIILINAHAQIKNFSNPLGDNYDRYEMKVSKKVSALAKEWSDVVLFAQYKTHAFKENQKAKAKGVGGQQRVVKTQYSAAWDAKNRYGMPDELALDMEEILIAIDCGLKDNTESIIQEIQEALPFYEEPKQKEIINFVDKNKDNVIKLTQLLNKIRIQTEEK